MNFSVDIVDLVLTTIYIFYFINIQIKGVNVRGTVKLRTGMY